MIICEWDPKKNSMNLEKHGLDFEHAREIFEHKVVSFKDVRNEYGEDRFITIGILEPKIMVVVVHTYRKNVVRIISARKANKKEKKIYEENT